MHKYKVTTTGGGYSVLNNGVETQVISQDGSIIAPISLSLGDDDVLTAGTTTTTAATKITLEFDKTTTGVGQVKIGSLSVPQVLNTNPGASVAVDTVNILHSAGAGDCDDLLGRYTKVAVSGAGDSGLTMVADAPRAYVLAGVAKEVYASQPWISHAGTGAVTAMSALSAKADVNTDNFTASTVNAGHFHIEGAATVTGQFDGVMIEAYPDVRSLDSGLAIAVDSGAVVQSGIRITGTPKNGIKFQSGATISSGAGTDDASIKSEQGATAPAGSIYIGANGTVFVMVSTTWTALTIN
jgi:hypothetical protein